MLVKMFAIGLFTLAQAAFPAPSGRGPAESCCTACDCPCCPACCPTCDCCNGCGCDCCGN